MFRPSEEIWQKLGEKIEEVFTEGQEAKKRGEEPDYKKFNAYWILDQKIKAAITEGLQNIEVTGWYE